MELADVRSAPVDQVKFDAAAAAEFVDHGPVENVDRAVDVGQLVSPFALTKGQRANRDIVLGDLQAEVSVAAAHPFGLPKIVTPLAHNSGRGFSWPKGASCSIWPTVRNVN